MYGKTWTSDLLVLISFVLQYTDYKYFSYPYSYSNSIHYNDVIMNSLASQVTNPSIVFSTVYSRRRSKKISKLRVTGLYAENSPVSGEFPAHKGPVTRKMFPFDDVIMQHAWELQIWLLLPIFWHRRHTLKSQPPNLKVRYGFFLKHTSKSAGLSVYQWISARMA